MSVIFPIPHSSRVAGPFTAAAGQTVFPGNFPIQSDADVQVKRVRPGSALGPDVTSILTLDTDYSISGVGAPEGFTVTLAGGALAGDLITLTGLSVIDRLTSVAQGGMMSGKRSDEELDRNRMINQELRRDVDAAHDRIDTIHDDLTAESAANVAAAQAAATAAAASATAADADAAAALADRLAADADAAAAAGSAVTATAKAAEATAARDGALIGGTIYSDEPTGRAAVADGAFFKVAGAVNADEAVKVYRRNSAGLSEQRPSFPAYDLVARLTSLTLRAGSDMAGLLRRKTGYLWVANDRYSVFSDAAATVFANPGDYCPLWKDQSGRNNHFTKNASYNAPVLREDARGVRYLEFVGASEDRTLDAAVGGNSAAVFAAAAIRVQSATGTVQQVLVASDDPANGWVLGQNNTGCRWEMRSSSGTTVVADNVAGITPAYEAAKVGEILVMAGGFDGARAFKWKNGHRRMNVAATYTPKASPTVRLAHNIQNTVGEGITHLYAACLFTEALTFQEQQVVNAYLASLVPVHGRATSTLSLLKNKIELGAGDVTIAQFSDSLGDSEEEYFYPIATYFAGLYPAFTVEFTAADYNNNTMFSTVTINAGTNGRKIRFFSFAQSGGVARRYFADRYPLVTALGNIDLAIFNVGKNIAFTTPDEVMRGEFLAPMEQLRATYPAAGVCAVLQPPNMLDDEEDSIYRVLRGIMADWRELYLINAADPWKARGRRQSDYQDPTTNAIHPNNADPFFDNGAGLTTSVFKAEYNVASVIAGPAGARMLATTHAGLLINPKFAAWTAALPDNWTLGSGTVAKDTVIFATGTYSLLITGVSSYVYQEADATALASLTVFALTRAAPADADSGSIEIEWLDAASVRVGNVIGSTGDGGSSTGAHSGGFAYTMICGAPKPVGATKARIRLRGGATGAQFNDISVVAGNKPMTLA